MVVAKSKVARKKRAVSKHVLKGEEEREKQMNEEPDVDIDNADVVTNPNTPTPKPKKKPTKKHHIKDPMEAAGYLSSWQQRTKDKTSPWKFNKNTQSWLIRHMYEPEKAAKGPFSILMKYLEGLEGKTTRVRIRAEASRRALRYKNYEKKRDGGNENGTEKEQDDDEKKPDDSEEVTKQTGLTKEEQDEEALRWKKLDDHDKRKEYKRARKVLEVMKEQS
jgi:hypothetical protein